MANEDAKVLEQVSKSSGAKSGKTESFSDFSKKYNKYLTSKGGKKTESRRTTRPYVKTLSKGGH